MLEKWYQEWDLWVSFHLSTVDWRRATNCQPYINDQSKVPSDDHSWTTACQSHQVLFSVHFSSVGQSCLTLCDSMDCSTLGLPVHHQLPELIQTPVHWVGDAIQPSHPLLSPSPPAFNLSQHQDLFRRVSSSHQVVKGLEFQFQHWSFQWTPRTDLL